MASFEKIQNIYRLVWRLVASLFLLKLTNEAWANASGWSADLFLEFGVVAVLAASLVLGRKIVSVDLWRIAMQILTTCLVGGTLAHMILNPYNPATTVHSGGNAPAIGLFSDSSLPWASIMLLCFSLPALLLPETKQHNKSPSSSPVRSVSSLKQLGQIVLCAVAVFGLCFLPDHSTETIGDRIVVILITTVVTIVAACVPNVRGGFILKDTKTDVKIFLTVRWVKRTLSVIVLLPFIFLALDSVLSSIDQWTILKLLAIWVAISLIIPLLCGFGDDKNFAARGSLAASAVGAVYGLGCYSGQLPDTTALPIISTMCFAITVVTISVAANRPQDPQSCVAPAQTPGIIVDLPTEEYALTLVQALEVMCPSLWKSWRRIVFSIRSIAQRDLSAGKSSKTAVASRAPALPQSKLSISHVLADLGLVEDRQELWAGKPV